MVKMILGFVSIAGILLFLPSFTQQPVCDVTVVVTGLRNSKGQIMVSLNRGPKDFPDSNYFLQNYYKDFKSPTHTLLLKNVPYGNYAFSLLHDENLSGEMDFNWVGLPKEGFAFSGNYHVVFRSPKYEEANFKVHSPTMTIEVEMQY